MRRIWIAVLGLAACGPEVRPLDEEFRDVTALIRSEQYDAAGPRVEAAITRAARSGDRKAEWGFRLMKADILLGRSKAKPALSLLDSYGDLPKGSDWAEERAHALLLRGHASYLASQPTDSDNFLRQAADAAREAHADALSSEVELRRGVLLTMQARFPDSEAKIRNVLQASTALRDPYLKVRATNNMGFVLFAQSRYDEAIPWFERAKVLAKELDAKESIARADGSLGNCYARLGDSDNARMQYDRAQAAFAAAGNRYEQQTYLGNTGNLFLDAEDYNAAIASYTRALAIAREIPSPLWSGRWLSNLAKAYIELGDWDKAENYYTQAREVKRSLHDTAYETNSLNNAARIAAGRNRFDESARLFREAVKGEGEDPTVALEAHAGLARLFVQKGQRREAEGEYRAAIEAIDKRGANLLKAEYQLSFLGSLIGFYRQYVDFLMDGNDAERALEIAESSRSRVLAGRSGSLRPAIPRTAKDYQRIARTTGAVLLEFWMGKDRSYLWVITPEKVQVHVLPSRNAIHPLIENWRAVIAGNRSPLDVAGETGRKLRSLLLSPVAVDAPGKTRFVIVPDDDLYSLNFESLPDGDDSSKFWIEQATIAIAPSLNYLAAAGPGLPHPQAKLLLIGDPESTDPNYPKLEYGDREINSIASAMTGSEATVFKGAAARPDSYAGTSPGRFGFIHFSAHAFANPVNPLESAVILSGPPDRCRLRARDVMEVPLTAALVTVSGCRSAGSKAYAGEGLVGFAWAFLRAGAGNVIAGLWDVNDRSTMQLMSGLYTEIAAGSSIPEALRKSKLALIHAGGAYAKPFYWAPFQLYTSGQIVFR